MKKIKLKLMRLKKKLSDPRDNDYIKLRSFIGAILIYFSYGGIIMWGSIKDYLVSYFRVYNPDLTLKDVNILLAGMAIPCGLSAIFSIQLTNKIGYKTVFKSCALIYAFGVFFSAFCKNFYLFAFFYSFMSGTAAGFSYTPIIFTIWNHFHEVKGRISGYMFAAFGLSNLFFIPFATFLVNPENKKAEIEVQEGMDTLSYFTEDVYKNVPRMLMIIGLIYFVCCFIGSHLLEPCDIIRVDAKGDSNLYRNDEAQRNYTENEFELQNKNDHLHFFADPKKELNTYENKVMSPNIHESKKLKDDELLLKINNKKINNFSKSCPNLKTGLFSKTFIILFFNSIFIANFSLFLNINFKTYGLTKIKDDYFITFAAFLNGIASTIGRVFWGYILDRVSFKILYLMIQILLAVFSFTFPFFSYSSTYFAIWIFCIAFCDGGMMCILGPGLIKIFGMDVGAKLYPIKACSFYISLIIVPIIQFFIMDYISMDNLFHFLAIGNSISVFTGLFLKDNYLWKTE